MELQTDIQKALFESIRNRLSPHISLVDEVADLLVLSPDSAYRRIRGEKPLSLAEAEKLAVHYNVSIDNLVGISSDSVSFQPFYLDEEKYNFGSYLNSLERDMAARANKPSVELIFQLNELNLYHAIQFPEILAFKMYFWSKSSLDFRSFRDLKFVVPDRPDEMMSSLILRIIELYVKFNTIELLTPEFLVSFLKQVEFYHDSGFFERSEDALRLCNSALELIEHLRKQAEYGFKFANGSKPLGREGNFKLYFNNLTLVDNTILVKDGDEGMTYLTNGAINLLRTTNQDFFRRNLEMVNTLLRKSTLISGNAERERNLFFNNIRESVIRVMEKLKDKKKF